MFAINKFYSLEYIIAMKPSEYCNEIPLSELKPAVNEIEIVVNNPSVYQGTHSHIYGPHLSSSDGSNSMRGLDLNQFPAVEYEDVVLNQFLSNEDEGIDLNQSPALEHEGIDLNQFPSNEDEGIDLNQFPAYEDKGINLNQIP